VYFGVSTTDIDVSFSDPHSISAIFLGSALVCLKLLGVWELLAENCYGGRKDELAQFFLASVRSLTSQLMLHW
jgi:hypothetical protein